MLHPHGQEPARGTQQALETWSQLTRVRSERTPRPSPVSARARICAEEGSEPMLPQVLRQRASYLHCGPLRTFHKRRVTCLKGLRLRAMGQHSGFQLRLPEGPGVGVVLMKQQGKYLRGAAG
jgi:hypothetical protein